MVGAFIGGLKPELAAEARVHRSKIYLEMNEIALLRDDHLTAVNKGTWIEPRKMSMQPLRARATQTSRILGLLIQGSSASHGRRSRRDGRKDCALITMRSLYQGTNVK